MKIFIHHIL